MCALRRLLLGAGLGWILGVAPAAARPLPPGTPVHGWTLLSDHVADDLVTIAAAPAYGINHLQLSHDLVHNLREMADPQRCEMVNRLTAAAHTAGIAEVVVWDHAFYNLDYYPDEFRRGPGRTLDLDDPRFWAWFAADYRRMLDRVPDVDGVVLTFIETGGRAEAQYSRRLRTGAEKLATLVNRVADVVIGERGLRLYARTFAYSEAEYALLLDAVNRFERPEICLMMKETPHDFFLTHPDNPHIGTMARPTLIEFDAAGEFHGQGIVANTWPGPILDRWRRLSVRPHVVGYTARTDRYGDTRLVGRPGEINLLALARGAADPAATAESVTDEFITAHYGAAALPDVKAAFAQAYAITTATFYTLGTNTANHSALNYDPYASSYVRHVSGRWLNPPIAHVGAPLDRDYHYWRDVVDRLAPAFLKAGSAGQWREVPGVREGDWIKPGERMDPATWRDLVAQKDYAVACADQALAAIERARPHLTDAAYRELHACFERTQLTALLHRAVATAYFGFRLWSRGPAYQSAELTSRLRSALPEIRRVAARIRTYPVPPPVGQWHWSRDAEAAERYYAWIAVDGWPARTNGFPNPSGGLRFPLATVVADTAAAENARPAAD